MQPGADFIQVGPNIRAASNYPRRVAGLASMTVQKSVGEFSKLVSKRFLELPPGRFAADPVLGSHCFNVTMFCVRTSARAQGELVSANWIEHLKFYQRLDAVSYNAVWRTGSDGRWLTTKVHFFTTNATPGMFWNLPGSVSAPPSMKETIKRTTRRRRLRRNRTGLMDGCSTTAQNSLRGQDSGTGPEETNKQFQSRNPRCTTPKMDTDRPQRTSNNNTRVIRPKIHSTNSSKLENVDQDTNSAELDALTTASNGKQNWDGAGRWRMLHHRCLLPCRLASHINKLSGSCWGALSLSFSGGSSSGEHESDSRSHALCSLRGCLWRSVKLW